MHHTAPLVLLFVVVLCPVVLLAHPPRWFELTPSYSYEAWLSDLKPTHRGSKVAFEANLRRILAHNADESASWRAGINQFTGLTPAAFEELARGLSPAWSQESLTENGFSSFASGFGVTADDPLPSSVNWTAEGVVTPVKNQAHCGSCWSFSAAETIESAAAIASGSLVVLSEQELIDCTADPGDCGGVGGCHGATQELAYATVIGNGGLAAESSYPYKAINQSCPAPLPAPAVSVGGFVVLPMNNYSALMSAVAFVGPIALTGYGHDPTTGLDYWLVRNSWGKTWGEAGYIRLARYGSSNPNGEPCGYDDTPQSGYMCKNQSSEPVLVCGLCGILSHSSFTTGAFVVGASDAATSSLSSTTVVIITVGSIVCAIAIFAIAWVFFARRLVLQGSIDAKGTRTHQNQQVHSGGAYTSLN